MKEATNMAPPIDTCAAMKEFLANVNSLDTPNKFATLHVDTCLHYRTCTRRGFGCEKKNFSNLFWLVHVCFFPFKFVLGPKS